MILRVPDYYQKFSCIADQCKDSCCIGWEIDIDDDTYEFYRSVPGEMGERLSKYMYLTPEGEHSFELQKHGRCPFLNETNLCDLCIAFGEEALSEVCTEYPRFAIEYGNVLQKCLSLSCEEAGRILFTKGESVKIVDIPMAEDLVEDEDAAIIEFLEKVQQQAIDILQDSKKHISDRMKTYLCYIEYIQSQLNNYDDALENDGESQNLQAEIDDIDLVWHMKNTASSKLSLYDFMDRRFQVFEQMETLDEEWELTKKEIRSALIKEEYNKLYQDYIESDDFCELDYEQLMVYFTFRYFMNAVYDFDLLSYAKFAVVCTLVIRDMDIVRYHRNHGSYTKEDRIDVVRIFSKEVEHSEDNVEFAREEFLFDEIFTVESLCKQI